MVAITDVVIDSEFKAKLLPNPAEVVESLESSVRRHGFLDKVRVWKGTNILVDGHTRYGLWMNNQELPPPEVEEIEFDSRQAVLEYILENQLSRRNLTPKQAALYRGELYNARKGVRGGTGANQHQPTNTGSVAEEIAAKTGVSPRTVKNDAKLASDVATITEAAGPEVREAVVNSPLTRQEISDIATKPPEEIPQAVEQAKSKPRAAKDSPQDAGAFLTKAKTHLEHAVSLCIKAERANGGEGVYSRPLLKSLDKALVALEDFSRDVAF